MSKLIKLFIILLIINTTYALDDKPENSKDEDMIILQIQTIEPIIVKKTRIVKAKFTDLKQEAINIGINDLYLSGQIQYTPKNKKWMGLEINWQSLEDNATNDKKYIAFTQSAKSKILTDDKRIEPPTELSMQINKQMLIDAISKMQTKEKKLVALDENTITSLNKDNKQTTLAQTGNNGDDSNISSLLPDSQLNATQEDTTTSQATKECPIRYSISDLKAYAQERRDTVDSKGNTVVVGNCLDNGTIYELAKTYGTPCRVVADPVQDIIYQAYRITGVVDSVDTVVRDCKVDYASNTIAVLTTTDQCSPIHQLDTAVSHETSRKYYLLNSANVHLTNCAINGIIYNHQKTICSYDLQVSDGFAIPQVKTYITLSDNSELTVQNCSTESSTQLPIIAIECTGSQRYNHDFSTQISYLNKQKWVRNPYDNNNLVKVNDCQISATTFTHLETTAGCTPIYEDHNLLTNQRYKTYIEDGTATIYLDTICGSSYQIPYTPATISLSNNGDTKTKQYIRLDGTVYNRAETTSSVSWTTPGNHTWTVPSDITQIYVTVRGGQGGQGGASYGFSCYLEIGGSGGDSSILDIIGVGSSGSGWSATCPSDGDHSYESALAGVAFIPVTVSDYKNVNAGQSISITVGSGGGGVTLRFPLIKGSDGVSGYATIKY